MEAYNNGMNPDAMLLNTTGITAASKALNAATLAAAASSKSGPKYKKAPDAPKRFKSAFIIFSAEKHKEIKDDLISQGRTEKTTDIAKLVSEAWREMPAEEKELWEKKARKDKARYEVEKAMYKGPWKVQANKRTPKDPQAPKRPMSAFLAFSNKRRAALKREHPDATNADLSKMLSKTWKEIPDDLRKEYMDDEAQLRATYKVEVAKWRTKVAEEKKLERHEREAVAMQTAEARAKDPTLPLINPSMNLAVNSARNNQYNGGPPNQGNMVGPGQVPSASQQDMNGGMGGYGNPYGMPGGGMGGPIGQIGSFGMPGAGGGGPGGPDAAQYASLMAGGNPFAAQSFMGNSSSTQQQLLSQLFAGQQFKNPMGQGGALGMYPGLGGQGMQGGFGNNMGGYGGYPGGGGGMPNNPGNNGGMDMAATQRAMFEAAAQNGGPMPQQQQQQPSHPSQQMHNPNQGMNSFNPNMNQFHQGGGGGMPQGNVGGMVGTFPNGGMAMGGTGMPNGGGGPPGSEWMNHQQQQYNGHAQPPPQQQQQQQQQEFGVKKEDENDQQQQPQYR